MNKKFLIVALIATSMLYADEFYEGSYVNLENSVISTTGFAEKTQNVTNTTTVITSEEINEKNFKTVAEVLESVPNIVISKNVFGGTVDLRGQGSRAKANVQILVDGVNLNPIDRSHGVMPLNSIDLASVERIEVIPGGGAVLYGGGTVGGVINIITKNSFPKKVVSSIGLEAGSYGTMNYTGSLGGNIGKNFSLGANYDKSLSDGYRKFTDSDKEYYDLVGKYKGENQDLSVKYSKFTSDNKDPGQLTKAQLDSDRDAAYVTEDMVSKLTTDREELSLNYNYDLMSKAKFSLNASKTESTTISNSKGTYGHSSYTSTTNFGDDKISVKPKINYEYKNGSLVLGYDYMTNDGLRDAKYFDAMASMSNSLDMNKTSQSFFVQNRYELGKVEFTTGVRYEDAKYNIKRFNATGIKTYDYDKNLDDMAYSLGVNYLYSESAKLYLRAEKGYVLPAPNELINKNISGAYYVADTKNENFITYELGFEDFIGSTNVKGAIYQTQTSDEIAVVMNGTKEWTYYNIDETTRRGIEVSAAHSFGKVTLSEGVAIIDAKISKGTNKDKVVPGVSKTSANIDLKYEATNKLDIGVNTTYKSKYYVDAANESGLVNEKINMNLYSNYEFKEGSKVYFGINNVLNSEYNNAVSYSGGTFTYDPAAERNYYVGIKYSF